MRMRTYFLIAGVVCAASCQRTAEANPAAVRPILDSLLALHGQNAVKKNVDGMLAAYTEDAVVRSNHMEPLRGHAALRDFFTGLFTATEVQSLTYRTEGLAVYGDSAWQIVTYDLSLGAPGQPAQTDHGSGMALWVRDPSGAWRIKEDLVNSSVPLPAPAPQP